MLNQTNAERNLLAVPNVGIMATPSTAGCTSVEQTACGDYLSQRTGPEQKAASSSASDQSSHTPTAEGSAEFITQLSEIHSPFDKHAAPPAFSG